MRVLLGAGFSAAPGWPARARAELDLRTPVKPTPRIVAVVPTSTGVSSSTVIRTRMNCGLAGSRLIDRSGRPGRRGRSPPNPWRGLRPTAGRRRHSPFSPRSPTWLSQMMNTASAAISPSTTLPTRIWLDLRFHQAPASSRSAIVRRRGRAAR